ncbi:unnamed protein product [Rotaria sp. Silwood2]|nr:unnamed protein product [Rotaria sp. Silwood2]
MAAKFQIEILRLPVRHCVLNPIELAWAGVKSYIRENNTPFRLNDVDHLALEYIAAVNEELATSFFFHAIKHEDIFKAGDAYMEEELEPLLEDNDSSEESDEVYDDEPSENF